MKSLHLNFHVFLCTVLSLKKMQSSAFLCTPGHVSPKTRHGKGAFLQHSICFLLIAFQRVQVVPFVSEVYFRDMTAELVN